MRLSPGQCPKLVDNQLAVQKIITSCIWKTQSAHNTSGVENFIQSLISFLISLMVTSTLMVTSLLDLTSYKSEGENG